MGLWIGGDWVWLVSEDVVVAVDVGTWDLLGEVDGEGPAAQMGGGTIREGPGWRRLSRPRTGD